MRFNGNRARQLGLRPSGLALLCVSVACVGGAVACGGDDNGGGGGTDSGADVTTGHLDGSTQDSSTGGDSSVDSGVDAAHDGGADASDASDAADARVDAPSDAAPDVLADADAEAGPALTFCQMPAQAGLNFCNDFDLPNPLFLDGGAESSWTQVVGTPAELQISSTRSESAPDSLFVTLPFGDGGVGNGDQSAKVVEQVTPVAGVSQAVYEFDINIAAVPAAGTPGGFATDFQFDDNGGADRFGFRIGIFANAGTLDHVDLEHNHPNLGGPDDITSPIDGFTVGQWSHVKMVVAFSGSDAGADAGDGGNSVHFQLFVNRAASASLDATYPASFAKATFARFAAGMVFAFDGTNKEWGINYDNFTLKVQ